MNRKWQWWWWDSLHKLLTWQVKRIRHIGNWFCFVGRIMASKHKRAHIYYMPTICMQKEMICDAWIRIASFHGNECGWIVKFVTPSAGPQIMWVWFVITATTVVYMKMFPKCSYRFIWSFPICNTSEPKFLNTTNRKHFSRRTQANSIQTLHMQRKRYR